MLHYSLSLPHPQDHFIHIRFRADNICGKHTEVALPAWRPGRYEIGNFSRNIRQWQAMDENGRNLNHRKTDRNTWRVDTEGVNTLIIDYSYYAAEINAGSSFLDETQMYVNPVNLALYIPGRLKEECTVELRVPAVWKVACAMKREEWVTDGEPEGWKREIMHAENFHEVADSPFIVSPTLLHNLFIMDGVEFNLWFQGEIKPDWPRLINDFFIFINEQFMMMKEVPTKVYHFLFQILPYRFYHGVEHLNSTVIALGPSHSIMQGKGYEDLLGVSSHELFHAWNVKCIRPEEMHPYDYSKENYSRQGFVYEGVTTYYGDLFLFRSGAFSAGQWRQTFNERLQKHFDNPGRFNMSVAESSFDTWVDGYVTGIPNRKTNIYDEGCLLAFATDVLIRENSNHKRSLDDVMRTLYYDYAKKGAGYSEGDYIKAVNAAAGADLGSVFQRYVYGKEDYTPLLRHGLDVMGMELREEPSSRYHEAFIGFKIQESAGSCRVAAVHPGSVADISGIRIGDEIVSVNGYRVNNDLEQWCRYFAGDPMIFFVFRAGEMKMCKTIPLKETYYKRWTVQMQPTLSEAQKRAYTGWCKMPPEPV
ncbi:MAG: M61 family metallopeptidase [Bacteroidia bacterium]|nr:M61 family metallopeptidase [Bacteroidia bacterium]